MTKQLIEELRRWGGYKVGDIPPAPDNNWGPPLSKLLNQAADALEQQLSPNVAVPTEPKIITELRAFLLAPDKSLTWALTADDARAIITEYDRMRGLAGAVSDGQSFAELTKGFSRGSMPNG